MARPGPNELCPCGSGKKYKRCHQGQEARIPSVAEALPPVQAADPNASLGPMEVAASYFARKQRGEAPRDDLARFQDEFLDTLREPGKEHSEQEVLFLLQLSAMAWNLARSATDQAGLDRNLEVLLAQAPGGEAGQRQLRGLLLHGMALYRKLFGAGPPPSP